MRAWFFLSLGGLLLLAGCVQPPVETDNTTGDPPEDPPTIPSPSPPPVAPSPTPERTRVVSAVFGWNTFWVNETGTGENRTHVSDFPHCGSGRFLTGPDHVVVNDWETDIRIEDHMVLIDHEPQNGLPFPTLGTPDGFGFWQGGPDLVVHSLVADGWRLNVTFGEDRVTIGAADLAIGEGSTWRFVYQVDSGGTRYEVTEVVHLSHRGATTAERVDHGSPCL